MIEVLINTAERIGTDYDQLLVFEDADAFSINDTTRELSIISIDSKGYGTRIGAVAEGQWIAVRKGKI